MHVMKPCYWRDSILLRLATRRMTLVPDKLYVGQFRSSVPLKFEVNCTYICITNGLVYLGLDHHLYDMYCDYY